jgi:hypothetical protein
VLRHSQQTNMSDSTAIQKELRRYASLIEPMLASSMLDLPAVFAPEAEDARSVQVERGIVFPSLLNGHWVSEKAEPANRLVELSHLSDIGDITVVDRRGHHRPVYRGLLVYAWLQAYRLAYETMPRDAFGRWEEGLRPWCDLLENLIGDVEWFDGPTPAGRGATIAEAAWMALALHVAGKVFVRDAWTDLAGDVFGKVTRGQQDSGAFLTASARDNPETYWYHELVILHATASYAVQAEDRTAAAAVARNGEFHLRETQPDHATTQPWGVFAFAWNPQTRSLADQVLHAASTQSAAGVDGVSLVLLADAVYCLRLFF